MAEEVTKQPIIIKKIKKLLTAAQLKELVHPMGNKP